jgi:hypothetical protein
VWDGRAYRRDGLEKQPRTRAASDDGAVREGGSVNEKERPAYDKRWWCVACPRVSSSQRRGSITAVTTILGEIAGTDARLRGHDTGEAESAVRERGRGGNAAEAPQARPQINSHALQRSARSHTPSPMLRMVPLPRCAGEDHASGAVRQRQPSLEERAVPRREPRAA